MCSVALSKTKPLWRKKRTTRQHDNLQQWSNDLICSTLLLICSRTVIASWAVLDRTSYWQRADSPSAYSQSLRWWA